MRSAATYILNWVSSCASVSSVASSAPVWNVIPARSSQRPHRLRVVVGDPAHLGDERALRQPLLVDPERVEQLVVDDRVVHPHAALVEDADDRLLALELGGERAAALGVRAVPGVEVADVTRVMRDRARLEPGREALASPVVGEVLAPQRRVRHPGLGQARAEVEQADEARILPAPVGDEQDRAAVGAQARQDVVAVLPHGFDHHQRRVGREPLEDLDAGPLAVDEPVLADLMTALHGPAEVGHRAGEVVLQLGLRRPAGHVRGVPQVAARDRVEDTGHRSCLSASAWTVPAVRG